MTALHAARQPSFPQLQSRQKPVFYRHGGTAMFALTRQEQLILVSIIAALIVGAVVKHWRETHPSRGQADAHSFMKD